MKSLKILIRKIKVNQILKSVNITLKTSSRKTSIAHLRRGTSRNCSI